MIITYELRNWASIQVHELVSPMSGRAERELLSIADRIDEQHRKALEKVAAMVDEPTALDKLKGHLDGLDKIAAEYRFNIVALERRVSVLERKLNHKGGAE